MHTKETFEQSLRQMEGRVIADVFYESIPWDAWKDHTDYPNETPFDDVHSVDYCVHLATEGTSFRIGWGWYNEWAYTLTVDSNAATSPAAQFGGRLWQLTGHPVWASLVGQPVLRTKVFWAGFDDITEAFPQALMIGTAGAQVFLSAAEFIDDAGAVAGSMDNLLVTANAHLARTLLRAR